MKRIAIYNRHITDADKPQLQLLIEILHSHSIETQIIQDGDDVTGADFLFSIGGDGTLLASVQFVRTSSPELFPPIVGINFGHLGFLTTAGRNDIETLVDDLMAHRYTIEQRTLLQLHTNTPTPPYALNEVFVHRTDTTSLMRTHLYVDDDFVATYAGDGVIIATPTGSTAYSLSCGGPILTPDSGCLVVTPIGAHTLTLRPIIIPDTSHLHIVTDSEVRTLCLGVDSHRATIPGGSQISIHRAPFNIQLTRLHRQNFFSAIRDKLMWGTEIRTQ